MTSITPAAERVTDAKLDEMLAGLDGVTLGDGDPDDLGYSLSIAQIGRPYRYYQGALYASHSDYPDAEFRDYGLARAAACLFNNALGLHLLLSALRDGRLRSIITELQSLRRSSGTGEAGAVGYALPSNIRDDIFQFTVYRLRSVAEAQSKGEKAAGLYLHPAPAHDAGVAEALATKPEINDEREILQRLADGDEITYSRDGDSAWFRKGDRAFIGNVIIDMRAKGYLAGRADEDDGEEPHYVTIISDAGRAALAAGPAAGEQKP